MTPISIFDENLSKICLNSEAILLITNFILNKSQEVPIIKYENDNIFIKITYWGLRVKNVKCESITDVVSIYDKHIKVSYIYDANGQGYTSELVQYIKDIPLLFRENNLESILK